MQIPTNLAILPAVRYNPQTMTETETYNHEERRDFLGALHVLAAIQARRPYVNPLSPAMPRDHSEENSMFALLQERVGLSKTVAPAVKAFLDGFVAQQPARAGRNGENIWSRNVEDLQNHLGLGTEPQ